MAVLTGETKDTRELIMSCQCGCDEGIRIRINKDDELDDYAFVTYQNGNWYREQSGSFKTLTEKIKKIWRIIRNKDFYYSEIIMSKEDFNKFKEYVDKV